METATAYKKTIALGTVDYLKNGRNNCRVTVEVEIRTTDKGTELSMCGNVWNERRTDIYTGGQIYDTILELFPGNAKVKRMVEVWRRWHLNGMNAACEHQRADGWREKASQEVTLYHFRLLSSVNQDQKKIKDRAFVDLKAQRTAEITKEEQFLLTLSYELTTHTPELPERISEYYQPRTPLYTNDNSRASETKALGWLKESDHPDGILCRPCPVCGYKYGTAWLHETLPPEIVAEVQSW